MIKIPVSKIFALVGKLFASIPGGITPDERDELVALLLDILISIAPETISIPMKGHK